ncbi:hypothetical protein [Metamycoplasma buccale]|uniref:hypothetical protein n=1 Tax=Metamycoplasma buccale TaxID=55602 RepID=UPI00398F7A04
MNKKNKLLLWMASPIMASLALSSIACVDNKKPNPKPNNPENQKQKLLDDYAEKEFQLTIDASKYTLDEAKDINKYQYQIKSGYKFVLKELKQDNKKIIVKYSILDETNHIESKEVTKEFTNFKQSSNPSEDHFDASKYNELIALFKLNKNNLASKNISLLKNVKNGDFEITKVTINSYNDLDGIIDISVEGKYKNKNFKVDSLSISDFKKVISSLNNQITAKLNFPKLIEENKTIENIKNLNNGDLLKYFSILETTDTVTTEKTDILALLNTNNYKIKNFKLIKNGNDWKFNLEIEVTYKVLVKGETDAKTITKSIVHAFNQKITDSTYSEHDVLNYLLTKITRKNVDVKNEYASKYKSFYKKGINVSHNFFELENEDKYTKLFNASKIYIKDYAVNVNDSTGELYVSYQLVMNKNDKDYFSQVINSNINGFSKINKNELNQWFGIIQKNLADQKWVTIKNKIKDLYKKSQKKSGFEIIDEQNKRELFGSNENWMVMREQNNGEKFTIKDENSVWLFCYQGEPLKNAFSDTKNLIKEKFQINNINVKFEKISNFEERDGKLYFDFIFEITYSINSSTSFASDSETTITITKNVTLYI